MYILIESILRKALDSLGMLYPEKAVLEAPKNTAFGDLASNIAMVLAKEYKQSPRTIAEEILPFLQECDDIAEVNIAGAGFINIRFSTSYWHNQFITLEKQELFTPKKHTEHVLLEFVSANPTGPLHVGHARGAAFGDSLRRIFEYAGYNVTTEYYINDAGNQMRMLGYSVYLRLQELHDIPIALPEEYYKGDYIIDIAKEIDAKKPSLYQEEECIAINFCQEYATSTILASIKNDLAQFGVHHTQWFSESTLVQEGRIEAILQQLFDAGYVYEQDGAWWFASTRFGDDKDRVVKKNDGTYTYFASDIAYHASKVERGYTLLFDILGADHHGYVKRLQASIAALSPTHDVQLIIPLIQLVSLLRDGKPLSMSTRAGMFETLTELIEEVGVDAARFMFLSRRNDSPLEFDLSIVTQKTMDNPVYYVQYAHARIASLLERYKKEIADIPLTEHPLQGELKEEEEIAIIKHLIAFQQCIEQAVKQATPHLITQYVSTLAELFHRYYARYPLCSIHEPKVSILRLRLCSRIKETIHIALYLLGVSAPEAM